MKKIVMLLAFFLILNAARAQDEPSASTPEMDTDRPGKGDASSVVPKGYYQLEAGFNYLKDETNFVNVRELNFPETLFRAGVLDFAELRFRGQFTRIRTKFISNTQQESKFVRKGLERIMLGAKIRFLQNEGAIPQAALQADFELPIGSKDFNGSKVAPKLRLNFRNELSHWFSFHYNLGAEWEENFEPENGQEAFNHFWLYTLMFQYKLSDEFTAFIEAFGDLRENDMEQSFDAGIVYKIKPNLQLDLNLGYGLSEEATDFFGTAGISFRLPD